MPASIEELLRVSFYLPSQTSDEFLAFYNVREYLTRRDLEIPVTGFSETPIEGHYWSTLALAYIADKNTIITIDYKKPDTISEEAFYGFLAELKVFVMDSYTAQGCAREEIWVIANKVIRFM